MKNSKLSVMIPTYNYAEYLKTAITSVLTQDFTDYELIIVDNASTDNTKEVVESFKDDRIRYYRNDKNLGPRVNGNKCLEYSTGKYLRFLCADDVLLPGILGKQVDILDRNPIVGLVTCDMYVTDEHLQNRRRANFYPGYEKGQKVIRSCCMNFGNRIGGPSNVMFRREAAEGIRVNEHLKWISDLCLYCDILEKWDYYNIDEPGYLYRRHSASDTELLSKSGIQRKEELAFCLNRVGFSLAHLKYINKKIGWYNKIYLLKLIVSTNKINKLLKLLKYILQGKSIQSLLLSDYEHAFISPNIIYSNSNGIISIGKNTSINDFTVIRIENGLCADSETSSLIIGDNTYIGEHNNIRATDGVIRIGNNVFISQMVTIVSSNYATNQCSTIMSQPCIRNSVIIEDDVVIGAGCVILPGARIAKGSVIGANSVVKV